MIARVVVTTPDTENFDSAALQRLLDGRYGELRSQFLEIMSRPEFAPVGPLPTAEYRERVFEWARALAGEGLTAPGFPQQYGGRGEPAANVAAFETLGFGDLSLLVKFGVQFGLWGGAVHQLGTELHHERYLKQIATLELPGCFAMTEAAHGSNVQALRTTATYEPDSREFVIDTPCDDAHKDYIGNAACHGRMAVVFAQLTVGGERHGVHALLVPLRDEQGRVCDRVRIEDCGEKMGLGGVDNGRLWFDHVRVPREALLNRYGDVDEQGRYSSPIEKPGKRFFTMLSTLVQGPRLRLRGLDQRRQERAHDRRQVRPAPAAVRALRRGGGGDPRLPGPSAPADAAARHDVCPALRAGRAAREVSRGVRRPRSPRARAP